jgi:hypothetical protein
VSHHTLMVILGDLNLEETLSVEILDIIFLAFENPEENFSKTII